MKAAVLHGREDVRIEAVEIPPLGPGELLLRTQAALTCGTDVKVWKRGYHARMLQPPALFGHELAGVVEEVGPPAPNGRKDPLRPGERVVVANSAPCGACGFCRDGRESLCDDLVFWKGLPCSPCLTNYNQKVSRCPDPVCMRAISPAEVLEAIEKRFLAPDAELRRRARENA